MRPQIWMASTSDKQTWKEEGTVIAEAPATQIKEQVNGDAPDDQQNKDTKAQAEMLAKAISESTGPSTAPPPTATTPGAARSRSPSSSSSYYSDVESDSGKDDALSEKVRMRAGPVRQPAAPQTFVPPSCTCRPIRRSSFRS